MRTSLLVSFAIMLLLVVGGVLFFYDFNNQSADATVLEEYGATPIPAQAVLLPISRTTYIPIRDFNVTEPLLTSNSAVVYDIRSGRLLYSKNADEQVPIASITKVMTAVVVLENLDMDALYNVSVEDLNLDGFGPDFYRGDRFKGIDLLKAMLIKSSNDAAAIFVTQAKNEGIDLIGEMNKKALELDMTDTFYSDPAGLSDRNTYSTANDQVKLFIYVTKSYPDIWDILSVSSASIISVDSNVKYTLTSTNKLLGTIEGFIGGKTGLTDGALGTMSAVIRVSEKDEVIIIVLGTNDRFGEIRKLISWVRQAHSW